MSEQTIVFNGWAIGPEAWDACTFRRDRLFNYVEELDGVPARVLPSVRSALFVGFSMGGTMALRAFLDFPEKVRGLVLVSTTACMMERPDEGWAGMSLRRRRALYAGTKMMHEGDSSPLYRDEDLRRGLDFLEACDLRAELLAARDAGLTANVPARIVQSARDGIVRPQNAAFLASVFPRAEVTLVPGGEHVLPVTEPALLDAAVRAVAGEIRARVL